MIKAICNVNWNGRYVNEDYLRGTSDEMFRKDPDDEPEAFAEKNTYPDIPASESIILVGKVLGKANG